MPVKECITLHFGQAGCQVGLQLWELMCEEHDIAPDGTREADENTAADDPYNSFFAETAAGQHVPRCIMVDTDPSSREDILNSTHGKLFHPDNLLKYKQDARSNFFEGRSMSHTFKIKETVMDCLRKEVRRVPFFVPHLTAGKLRDNLSCPPSMKNTVQRPLPLSFSSHGEIISRRFLILCCR